MSRVSRRRAPGGAEVTTAALVEWLVFVNAERPPGFRMAKAVCDQIWADELWNLSADDLARRYREHHGKARVPSTERPSEPGPPTSYRD